MRVRPLPRRAASTERPARVLIRVRKPWVLARRRLFGWKVRFMASSSLRRLSRAKSAFAWTTGARADLFRVRRYATGSTRGQTRLTPRAGRQAGLTGPAPAARLPPRTLLSGPNTQRRCSAHPVSEPSPTCGKPLHGRRLRGIGSPGCPTPAAARRTAQPRRGSTSGRHCRSGGDLGQRDQLPRRGSAEPSGTARSCS